MFRGINPLSLDAKGRLSIPSKYRLRLQQQCEGQLMMTIDPDGCLLIYPLPVWEEVEIKILNLSSTNPKAKALKRLLIGYAENCTMDGNGRILVSGPLRDYAKLDKRVALIGQGEKFELWNEQTWHVLRDDMIALQKTDAGQVELASLSF